MKKRREKRIRQTALADQRISLAPIHPDRRTEILTIGKYCGYSDEKIVERLRSEGFSEEFPEHYRTTWNPYQSS